MLIAILIGVILCAVILWSIVPSNYEIAKRAEIGQYPIINWSALLAIWTIIMAVCLVIGPLITGA